MQTVSFQHPRGMEAMHANVARCRQHEASLADADTQKKNRIKPSQWCVPRRVHSAVSYVLSLLAVATGANPTALQQEQPYSRFGLANSLWEEDGEGEEENACR